MSRIYYLTNHPYNRKLENSYFVACLKNLDESKKNLINSINMLIQLKFIYQAIENKMLMFGSSMDFWKQLLQEHSSWLLRSKLLEDDIVYLKSQLTKEEQRYLFPEGYQCQSIKKIVRSIQFSDELKIFAWLSVRCLADIVIVNRDPESQRPKGEALGKLQFFSVLQGKQTVIHNIIDNTPLTQGSENYFWSYVEEVLLNQIEFMNEMEQQRFYNRTFGLKTYAKYGLFAVGLLGAGLCFYQSQLESIDQNPAP